MPKMSSEFLSHTLLHLKAKCQQNLGLWQSCKATGTGQPKQKRYLAANTPFSPRTAVSTLDDNQFIWSPSSPHVTHVLIHCFLCF